MAGWSFAAAPPRMRTLPIISRFFNTAALADICSQLTAVFQQVVIYAIPILGSRLLAAFLFSFFPPQRSWGNSSWPTTAAILTNCCVFDGLLESALIKLLQTDKILREGPGNAPGNYFRLCKNKSQLFPSIGRMSFITDDKIFATNCIFFFLI